jgi:NADH-quinone oxidoreductase subunit A
MSDFGEILLYLIGGIIFALGGLFTAWLIRPHRPNEEKLSTYECGEEPVGTAWGQFNVRYYLVGLIFILFDVEIVFLFPWATIFGSAELQAATAGAWGWFAFFEMGLFILILSLGLVYAWAKGYLDWVKPEAKEPVYESPVPAQLYQNLNENLQAHGTARS